MSAIIVEELRQLFSLRDKKAAAVEKLMMAEAEMQGFAQQNTKKDFIELHELDAAYRLYKPIEEAKRELEDCTIAFDAKKKFFINLLDASGCHKLICTHKEFNDEGKFEYTPYLMVVSKNPEGLFDLSIQQTMVHL